MPPITSEMPNSVNAAKANTSRCHIPESSVQQAIDEACVRMAPLWPLSNFVAVNPFRGLVNRPFQHAMEHLQCVTGSAMFIESDHYRRKFGSGEISTQTLHRAIEAWTTNVSVMPNMMGKPPTVQDMIDWANHGKTAHAGTRYGRRNPDGRIHTAADLAEKATGSPWRDFVINEISKWCAAYFDQGQAFINPMDRSMSLFPAWKVVAQADRTAELEGLAGFRNLVAELPDDAIAAVEYLVPMMAISDWPLADYFHRLLMDMAGWSGHIQYRDWHEQGKHKKHELAELLAIRLTYDTALALMPTTHWAAHRTQYREPAINAGAMHRSDSLYGYLWLLAAELAYEQKLLQGLRHQYRDVNPDSPKPDRSVLQAVFCIDVRSERLRRSLETSLPGSQTFGFAGFFGFPVEYVKLGHTHGSQLFPVLIQSPCKVQETIPDATALQLGSYVRNATLSNSLRSAWNVFKSSAVTGFSFVEIAGLAFGPKLIFDSLLRRSPGNGLQSTLTKSRFLAPDIHHTTSTAFDLDQQADMAANALKNMGLTDHYARLVLFCGHGSGTTNNPYGSSLDCGACGGNTGDISARIAAAVLNRPEVRHALQNRGIHIPGDTWFIAGLHNTTTDDVTLLDTHVVPQSHQHDLDTLANALTAASHCARQERSLPLGISKADGMNQSELRSCFVARSCDWAQIRPEWGLAGNAAFIAAPRPRTQKLNLDARVFLHDYQWKNDSDLSILRLIMSAPMVVAHWINMQYFASTVNQEIFGSGSKLLHNVVGNHGVCLGNGGDLRCGLPFESVSDGAHWFHDPLRLLTIIESPRSHIETIMSSEPTVKCLVDNGWINLIAVEESEPQFWRYHGGIWQAA